MIVITLTKVPQSLRGDLTKWYQEIQTGVYVGNVSARIRDLLWERIVKNIGNGEATMAYNTNNELGYQFRTTRKEFKVVNFDGIPLMMRLNADTMPKSVKHGFSNAAKFHRAKVMSHKSVSKSGNRPRNQVVSIDLETTGLEVEKDKIISIGAVKRSKDGTYNSFYRLIRIDREVPKQITELTGITSALLKEHGVDLNSALQELKDFVNKSTIVGYNLRFDEAFLSYNLRKVKQSELTNNMLDLMPVIKKIEKFLDNYRLGTVLKVYDIENQTPHNALSDAKATLILANKLMEKSHLQI
ncbi:MAG: type I-E CRISPR-associated endoribonuclease Cas2e [Lentilactobacillus diolivorans]|jgi:CRISPR-associated protein Cas2|nr:type I-E CRISPR-associated endoribonuclease Cas2e [Lentilactobacillus diolivorans]